MDWIKQNPKIVAAAAAFVVVAVLLFMVNSKQSKKVDELLEKRVLLAGNLRSAGKKVNVPGIGQVYPNQELIVREQARVDNIQQELADVRSDSAMFSRNGFEPLTFTDSSGQTMQAFPVPADLRNKGLLRFDVSQAFLDARLNLLAPYKIATPVSQDEFINGLEREIERLRFNKMFTSLPDERRTEETLRAMAQATLLERLRQVGSAGRTMYVDEQALRFPLAEASESVTMVELWKAQVSLWVMGDLLAAIDATNQAAVEGLPVEELSVADSAVKVVELMNVIGYVAKEPESVTRRMCSREYDVVTYDIVVVMPPRYLGPLMENLMSRNYHTVLNVSMQAYPVLGDSPYDLGDDSLVRVQLEGEMLLLTEWERELMPVEFMSDEAFIPQGALRQADRDRIRNAE